MIVTLCILSGILAISIWLLVIQIIKYNRLEKLTNNVLQDLEDISGIIYSGKELMDNPQLKAAFSSDDEVGKFFNNLESIQSILNNYILDNNGQETFNG